MGISTNICIVVGLFGNKINEHFGSNKLNELTETLDCVQPWYDCSNNNTIFGFIIGEEDRYFDSEEIKAFELEIEKAKKDFLILLVFQQKYISLSYKVEEK